MTAEVINLRRARKTKLRAQAETAAQENRVQFGRSKQEKNLTGALNHKAAQQLNQHKREPDKR